jgi:hypothetical protein
MVEDTVAHLFKIGAGSTVRSLLSVGMCFAPHA